MMSNAECPSEQELTAFHQGRLESDRLDEVASHLENCVRCESILARLDTDQATVAVFLKNVHDDATVDSPASPSQPAERTETSVEGTLIGGRYKLLEQIGEGGMGTVWMASQLEPVRRLVAVKLVKEGMDTRQVLARFDAERQALALMDHPNIARVLDAGASETGRPYFVMELVKGVPITRYCDEARLNPRDRLALFVDVCRALQHAHQKGVIHRDIKPSNVLVARYDGRPVPKVIDFGIAKAVGQTLTDRTLVTGFGAVVGTPEYMSPEQAEVNQLDIDTRSDVYALGILLYELLTGSTPIDRGVLQQAAILEILRVVREVEPALPSSRLSSSAGLPSLAAQRGIEPRRLTALIRGDLDWITMKALEKDRSRRYETANALARDLERFLADEPVEASPPSARYRLTKFARRHKGPIVAIIAIALILIVATAVSTVMAVVALDAREEERSAKEKEISARGQEKKAKETAQRRFAQTERVNEILASVFERIDPLNEEKASRPLRVVLAENLTKASDRFIDGEVGDPLTLAPLRGYLGRALLNLGNPTKAVDLISQALKTYEAERGPEELDTINCRAGLAAAYRAAGRLEDAIRTHERNLEILTRKFGPEDPQTLRSRMNLSVSYNYAFRLDESIRILEGTCQILVRKSGPLASDVLNARLNLAEAYRRAGRPADAASNEEDLLKIDAQIGRGPDDFHINATRLNLAAAYGDLGRFAEAIPLCKEAIERFVKTLGAESAATLVSRSVLAQIDILANRPDDAIKECREALKIMARINGEDHQDTLSMKNVLASAHEAAGRFNEAEPLRRDILERMRKTMAPGTPLIAQGADRLGRTLIHQGKAAEAEPLLRESREIRGRIGVNFERYENLALLASSLASQGKYSEAEPLALQAFEALNSPKLDVAPARRPRLLAESVRIVVALYESWGKPEQATAWSQKLPPSDPKK